MDSHLLTVEYRGRIELVRVWQATEWWAEVADGRSGPRGRGDSEAGAVCNLLEKLSGDQAAQPRGMEL
jgi:hypothetical protein